MFFTGSFLKPDAWQFLGVFDKENVFGTFDILRIILEKERVYFKLVPALFR